MDRYKNYKETGVQWLREIPQHWKAVKLKYIGEAFIGMTYSPDDVVDDASNGILVLRSSNIQNGKLLLNDNVFINKEVPEKLFIREGDILLCSRNGSRELIGKNILINGNCEKMTFGAFMTVFRSEYSSFLYYFFNSPIFKALSALFLSSTINQLTLGVLNDMIVALPPKDEQNKIAAFLNDQVGTINSLIEEKQSILELIGEETQSIIDEAVTKGINLSVPKKHSGIDWLGEIPNHWRVVKMKYLISKEPNSLKTGPFGSQLTSTEMVEEGPYAIYNQRNVLDKQFVQFKDYVTEEKSKTLKGFEVYPKDILITTRGTIGKAAIVPDGAPAGYLHPCLIAIRLDTSKILQEWALLYINLSTYFLENVLFESNSTTIEVIYGQTLREIVIPTPPSLDEQKAIVEFVNERISLQNKLCEELNESIEKLKEYRQSLIYEAVTGKIDVRDWELNSKKQYA